MSLEEIVSSNTVTENIAVPLDYSIVYKVLNIISKNKREIKLLIQYGSSVYDNESRDIDILVVIKEDTMISIKVEYKGKEYDLKIVGEKYLQNYPEEFCLFLFPHRVIYGKENYGKIVKRFYEGISKFVLNEGNKRKIRVKDLHRILWELESGASGYLTYKIRKYSLPLPREICNFTISYGSFKPITLVKIKFIINKILQYFRYKRRSLSKRRYRPLKRVAYLTLNLLNKLLFLVGLDISKEVYALRKQSG